jgi:hypothetical protein
LWLRVVVQAVAVLAAGEGLVGTLLVQPYL